MFIWVSDLIWKTKFTTLWLTEASRKWFRSTFGVRCIGHWPGWYTHFFSVVPTSYNHNLVGTLTSRARKLCSEDKQVQIWEKMASDWITRNLLWAVIATFYQLQTSLSVSILGIGHKDRLSKLAYSLSVYFSSALWFIYISGMTRFLSPSQNWFDKAKLLQRKPFASDLLDQIYVYISHKFNRWHRFGLWLLHTAQVIHKEYQNKFFCTYSQVSTYTF